MTITHLDDFTGDLNVTRHTSSTLSVAAAFVAAAGLLLTACGGGGSDNSDKIKTTGTAATTSAAATGAASPTQTAGPPAPKFDLPADVKVQFAGFTSSDLTDQAVFRDATHAATAVVETQALGNLRETPNLKRYFQGASGAQLADQLIAYARTGKVATGLLRYYAPKLTVNTEADSVTLKFCEDQRKAYDRDVKTGEVNVTTPSVRSFNSWTYVMRKSASGEWHVFNYDWVHGVGKCQVA